jgi:signal peptidase I
VTDAPTVGDDAVLDSIGAILASAMLPDAASAPSAVPAVAPEPGWPVERRPAPPVERPQAPPTERPTAPPAEAEVRPAVADRPDAVPDAEAGEPGPSRRRILVEWIAILGLALVIAMGVKVFVISSFTIPSESMHPTLQAGDRVLVNRLAYRAHDIRRGDVIVFARPPHSPINGPDAPKDLIKRVIGLPGDIVATHDGAVWINGRRLNEPYLPDGTQSTGLEDGVKVPAGHVWVMGDNRTNSADSRVFGPLSQRLVIGRAFARAWPPGRIGFL